MHLFDSSIAEIGHLLSTGFFEVFWLLGGVQCDMWVFERW